ncbi:response regulator [Actinomadura sp. SCN-SB]|uniref:response regulator n=1 Tax=Actinomadura sp. SCN-SB TaxID=3373092 RepID=UPI0037512B79
MRVLIVDDDAGVAGLLRTILVRGGHEVSVAADGAAGRSRLALPPPPDLLILDRMLPDMDGADLLAQVRADPRTARLPVLVISADRTPVDAYGGGATRVLAKPFDLADLRAALSALRTP